MVILFKCTKEEFQSHIDAPNLKVTEDAAYYRSSRYDGFGAVVDNNGVQFLHIPEAITDEEMVEAIGLLSIGQDDTFEFKPIEEDVPYTDAEILTEPKPISENLWYVIAMPTMMIGFLVVLMLSVR